MAPEVEPTESRSVILLLHCPLRLGLAASLTQFIYTHGGRILYHDQCVDAESNQYYTRLKWDISSFSMTEEAMTERLSTLIASGPDTEWRLGEGPDPLWPRSRKGGSVAGYSESHQQEDHRS